MRDAEGREREIGFAKEAVEAPQIVEVGGNGVWRAAAPDQRSREARGKRIGIAVIIDQLIPLGAS